MAYSFNSSKCQIRQPHIAFYSAVFTAQGMQPDPAKIQALQDFPTPNSQVNLQSSLGLINYLQPFIPNLSTKTMFLHKQLAKWDWNPLMDAAFMYYDRCKPVIVQTDASKYGLGAALIQNSCPITFASKMLTDIKPTMQILRESVCWCALALRNFTHTYMAGM